MIWWSSLAFGADHLALPGAASPADWREAASVAGLELGQPGPHDPVVRITAAGEQWTLRAEDGAGRVRSTTVRAPATAIEREEIAFLAQGLLRDLSAGALPLAP
ncbi:MAG: hypothetical protein ABMA64_41450, partial [Myxococcota bacterium]